MPPYPEKQSPLLVRLKQKKTVTEAEPTTEQQQQPSNSTDEPTTSKLAVNVPAQDTQNGLLVSLDTNESNGYYDTTVPAQTTTTTTTTTSSLASTKKFLFKNSDIIFENDLIQIGVKSEMKKNLLNIEFYYGNKTSSNISNLSAILNLPGELQSGTRIKTMVFQLKKNFDLTLRITSQFGNNHFVD